MGTLIGDLQFRPGTFFRDARSFHDKGKETSRENYSVAHRAHGFINRSLWLAI